MRKIYPKISAIVAMALTVLSFGLLAASAAFLGVEPPLESAYSASFAFWIYAALVSAWSLKYYTIDAILSAVYTVRKVDPVFNCVLAVVLIAGIPLGICVGGGPDIVEIIIWFFYYLGMFILELVSIIRILGQEKRPGPALGRKGQGLYRGGCGGGGSCGHRGRDAGYETLLRGGHPGIVSCGQDR